MIIEKYDCTVIEGHRSFEKQAELYRTGRSKVISGKHNREPSLAVDVAPYINRDIKIPWDDNRYFYHFAGYVKAVAEELGIKIRWGGDWDSDGDLSDQTFNDLVHFELVEEA